MTDLIVEIVEGPGAGRQVPLSGPLEVGRATDVGLALPDDHLVSRRHARFAPADGLVTVEDLGSRNGTFVNGDQIHGPTRLDPGDHVLIGVTVLEVRSPQQVAVQATAVRAKPPALAAPPKAPDY